MRIEQALKSRGFAVTVHLALWVLLFLGVTRLGGSSPVSGESEKSPARAHDPVTMARLERLFSPDAFRPQMTATNAPSPFATRHFMPRHTPATTRKLAVTYQGFFQTGDDPRRAIIRLDDKILIARVGDQIITNLFIGEATLQTLTLTNQAAQTNVLTLNTKKDIEVPIQ
ncbi:MAG TPA: hypothetical protein GYA07_10510 [Verrucomicrobia bacterium]|nr:hypothetical protein [Verrucomicrobiota bacterium]HOB33644.1 hypothetical protein [Verrucomicrobiota bacterium]HOP97821.1 hypothetical protein [Verrucomicrobiota bacterium]HPU56421.1 hypothetical protein [Verrucomicrobiota bacterium]